jgi:hypothetical protein
VSSRRISGYPGRTCRWLHEAASIPGVLGALLVVCFCGPAFAASAPISDIYGENGDSFELSEFVLTGSAQDDSGIAAVTVAIRNQSTGLWRQANGTWGAGAVRLATDLASPDAESTRWLYRDPLPVGSYQADAEALDITGTPQSAGTKIVRAFAVVADRADLNDNVPWLTIHFGRSIWGVAGEDGALCAAYDDPVNGTVFLDETAEFLDGHGYSAQGSVPFGQFDPNPAVRLCPWRGVMSASLNDLAMLRDTYDWTFVADSIGPLPSNPVDRPNIVSLTCEDQITTAAASLAELERLGHRRAWGLFADPGNSVTDPIRDAITSRLYTFTRKYGGNLAQNEITKAKALSGDWARFQSVTGGRCNDPSATCYDHHIEMGTDSRYERPDYVYPFMVATPGNWRGIQFYRFVRGTHLPAGYPGTAGSPAGSARESYWDCSSPNPDRRWTSRDEMYCYVDFVEVIERLADEHPEIVTADAAHVATSWEIGNANHFAVFPSCGATNGRPVASSVNVTGAAQVGGTLTGHYTYSDPEGDPQGTSTFRWLRNGSSAIPGATGTTYSPVAADVGDTLTFEVTPVAQSGTLVGFPVASAPTAQVTGSNQDPTIDITAPANGSSYVAGTPISLSANTSDPDLDTVSVEWTANGNPIAAPWTPVVGNYTVTATASDGNGGEASDSVSISVTASGSGVLPVTVSNAGVNLAKGPLIIDVASGAQNLATNWSNNGVNSTAWFTLDLGGERSIERLMVAPRGEVRYNLTISIGNSLTAGKVSGPASGACTIRGPTAVPTSLDLCPVAGTGRYITIQGDRPWLLFYGLEVIGTTSNPPAKLPTAIHGVGSNAGTAPNIIDTVGSGDQNLATSWTNNGVNATAWFTLDLGSHRTVQRLMVAPRGGLTYNLTVTIGDAVSAGKVTGSANGTCSIRGATITPTTLDTCSVGGEGRYVTVQGNKPYLQFYGIEAIGN